jgi:hypothetical protein
VYPLCYQWAQTFSALLESNSALFESKWVEFIFNIQAMDEPVLSCLRCGGQPMFSKLMDAMFGCRHARYSFPITVRAGSRRTPAPRTGTYVVCLDCGREFGYDWQEMKIMGSQPRQAAHSLVTKEAA